ncbi:hypothetical protein BO78DRAFT_33309 [Aspergillus sclerotiicarbonarius CBS 121057]|uniref:Uncharacterized protein n=1 Tax=Aspergillus sclerotiicarbonarius (strain CBS 121057 / IBT 28362) TaxID=1448318 RepID=A0A319EAV0_ASPSB|nr:hypothetical protein BO78DRAFT_33309 [Aspergillus sclerotiicarbonarius CBS 121057]
MLFICLLGRLSESLLAWHALHTQHSYILGLAGLVIFSLTAWITDMGMGIAGQTHGIIP